MLDEAKPGRNFFVHKAVFGVIDYSFRPNERIPANVFFLDSEATSRALLNGALLVLNGVKVVGDSLQKLEIVEAPRTFRYYYGLCA